MEQQAKERLTGGAILVVLLVLLVPELLTGPRIAPPPTPAQPDQAPMRSYTMDLGESPRINSAPVAASTAAPPASEPAVTVSSAPEPQIPRQPAATIAPQRVTPATPIANAPTARKSAATSPPRSPAALPAPAHAVGHAAEHAVEHSVEHSTGAWTVQLGTFSSRDNAAHLVNSLKSHGFSATISEITNNGRKLFRVRVGNEKDRAAAQKLLGRLKAAGEKGGEVVSH